MVSVYRCNWRDKFEFSVSVFNVKTLCTIFSFLLPLSGCGSRLFVFNSFALVSLSLWGPTVAPHIEAPEYVTGILGKSANIKCVVSARPPPKMFFWRDHDGRVPVILGNNYQMKIDNYTEVICRSHFARFLPAHSHARASISRFDLLISRGAGDVVALGAAAHRRSGRQAFRRLLLSCWERVRIGDALDIAETGTNRIERDEHRRLLHRRGRIIDLHEGLWLFSRYWYCKGSLRMPNRSWQVNEVCVRQLGPFNLLHEIAHTEAMHGVVRRATVKHRHRAEWMRSGIRNNYNRMPSIGSRPLTKLTAKFTFSTKWNRFSIDYVDGADS